MIFLSANRQSLTNMSLKTNLILKIRTNTFLIIIREKKKSFVLRLVITTKDLYQVPLRGRKGPY